MATCIEGLDIEIKVGSVIQADGWKLSCRVEEGDDFSPFRIPTGDMVIESLAVRFEITGRTIQRDYAGPKVRIKIIFVGDCEPDTTTRGWLFL